MYIDAQPKPHKHPILVADLRHPSLISQVPSDPLTPIPRKCCCRGFMPTEPIPVGNARWVITLNPL
jgi:hypothetical protein